MKQVLIHKGNAIIRDVPAPQVGPGEVLVKVHTSCLSVGTEMSGIRQSAVPLWKKALKQPEKVAATLKLASSMGLQRTLSLLEEKREAAYPTGYSATGIVVNVGADIHDIAIGDRVACAGAQCAHHAEFIRVPRNLCASLPESLSWESASTVTLGAIALQGIRRAEPTLGENFAVIGLGILGQLTVQLLKANGCRTIGIDIDSERIALALSLGMDLGLNPNEGDNIEQVQRVTDGLGVDGVIITAATPSDAVVSTAFKLCRKKGRVVLVGDVGLHLNRADFYVKEIDFLISSSYGPGRYDHRYEEQGLDYPVAYVRWTENRNMNEYLRLLAEKRIQVDRLISARYPISEASKAYASLNDAAIKPMMVLLTYPEDSKPIHTVHLKPAAKPTQGKIRVAVLGAGAFARSAHLPNLQSMSERFIIQAIVTRTGHNATAAAKQFGASYCSTDFDEVLSDPDVDAVIIATRHHQHGSMALAALQAGKHVLVEKPLALTIEELIALDEFINATNDKPKPILLTGYNRRFSPYARRMAELLQGRSAPFIVNYRMNAGYIPLDNWVHGPEGGGRNLGEACHIYDLFTYLTNAEVISVTAQSIMPKSHHYGRHDNFIATMTFNDGSVASLTYTALGAKDFPKETADLYVDGKLMVLSDYKSLEVHGIKGKSLKTSAQEKGLREELISFADAINNGSWPIPWWQQLQSAKIALLVEEQIAMMRDETRAVSK
ncbi:oxidoreductase [Legionella lansingensis]|uniref:Oxidoreductase n=1 Tax=Legionella lansingensis TaxID=45067 RepID=A0A0W0VVX9_9GAMM|nr:bi-domain-containing oxidoreductase [Legionella lansingensis]KTD24331.1 oxidoreductase [Legionella lansingensis]SNV51769.1 oxidoreductase [Legionella lansingensis]